MNTTTAAGTYSEFLRLCEEGNKKEVVELFERHSAFPFLLLAIDNGDLCIVKCLFEFGLKAVENITLEYIEYAAWRNHWDIVNLLLDKAENCRYFSDLFEEFSKREDVLNYLKLSAI